MRDAPLPVQAQLWIDRLEALGKQLPRDQVAHHAFVESWRGKWPAAGSKLEQQVIQLRLASALVAIYAAASTAATLGEAMAVSLEAMLRFLPYALQDRELVIVREQYAAACREIEFGNRPSPAGVQ
jgi:hypothetical protein